MRSDMPKIVNEPARGRVAYYRDLPNEYRAAKRFKLNEDGDVCDEFSAKVQPMRAKQLGWDGKDRRYSNNPLRRFLRSRVGRRWDDVFAEVCKVFQGGVRGNYSGYTYGRDLIRDDVEVNTWVGEDGQLYHNDRFYGTKLLEDGSFDFYVDPRDGTLRRVERQTWKARWREDQVKREAERAKTRVMVNDKFQLHKLDGNWYRVYLGPIPRDVLIAFARDALGPVDVDRWYRSRDAYYWIERACFRRYGVHDAWAVRKEAASRKDIRKYVKKT